MRRVAWILLPALFALAGLVTAADDPPAGQPEPPVLLKKKGKPAPRQDDKPPPAGEDKAKPPREEAKPMPDEPDDPVPEEDEQEVLNRISRNLRTVEGRLANREVGDGTLQMQRNILKDLDSLLSQNPPPQGGGGGAEQNPQQNNQQQQGNKQNQGGKPQASGGMGKGSPKMLTRSQPKSGRGQRSGQTAQRPGQGTPSAQNMAQNNAGTNPGGGGGNKPMSDETNRLADVYKDIWGHLPESMRGELDAYAREAFMAKYNEMIKQYYATVAEKSRQKER